ncbi:uncharacterized protein AstCC [Chelonus insularis]|uniref:uncharacterized protein AstCC n=1 Tax=Chelonus insularis TaxID=460826 RepID=UPI00158C2AC2|nr:uncharacterized protein LOC118067927 [Chelonus insularis]
MASRFLTIFFITIFVITTTFARVLNQRDIYNDNMVRSNEEDYNYFDYEEKDSDYPKVPTKPVNLFNKLIQVLQKVAKEERMTNDLQGEREFILENPQVEKISKKISSRSSSPTAKLQRRGHVNGSVYWRCYFNAVTCFKRK